jgi:hypothetical protein
VTEFSDSPWSCHLNLKSLQVTPAMAAGFSDRLWSLEELVEQTSI